MASGFQQDGNAKKKCSRCPKEAKPGVSLCEECSKIKKQDAQDRYMTRKLNGSCVRCSKPASDGSLFCEEHSKRESKWKARAIAAEEKLVALGAMVK